MVFRQISELRCVCPVCFFSSLRNPQDRRHCSLSPASSLHLGWGWHVSCGQVQALTVVEGDPPNSASFPQSPWGPLSLLWGSTGLVSWAGSSRAGCHPGLRPAGYEAPTGDTCPPLPERAGHTGGVHRGTGALLVSRPAVALQMPPPPSPRRTGNSQGRRSASRRLDARWKWFCSPPSDSCYWNQGERHCLPEPVKPQQPAFPTVARGLLPPPWIRQLVTERDSRWVAPSSPLESRPSPLPPSFASCWISCGPFLGVSCPGLSPSTPSAAWSSDIWSPRPLCLRLS